MARWMVPLLLAGLLGSVGALAQDTPAPPPSPPREPASAELAQFLARTPVTLMDWGMLRLERDLSSAVRNLSLDRGRDGPAKVGAHYRFGDRRVVAYVSLATPGKSRTEAQCRELFGAVKEQLLAGAPGAEWYLRRLFNSDIRRDANAPEPFGPLVLDMVLLEVTLRPPASEAFDAGPGRIACAGRLDAATAYIVPPPSVPGSTPAPATPAAQVPPTKPAG